MIMLPPVGLGTWDLRGRECTRTVKLALELGYRHIDTAHVYDNHKAIRKGIAGFDRSQLQITSKIAIEEQIEEKHVERCVNEACDLALKELGTEYLDLYLIHSPDRSFPMAEIFKAMEGLVQRGKIRAAGVSNFTTRHIEDLRSAGLTPAANQVEFHPHLYQHELLDYCRQHQVQLIAYRPFGKGKLLKDPVLVELGKAHGKTSAQITLRWLHQKEIPTIPKSASEDHLRENLSIFDFTLSDNEMKQIDALHRGQRYCMADEDEFLYI